MRKSLSLLLICSIIPFVFLACGTVADDNVPDVTDVTTEELINEEIDYGNINYAEESEGADIKKVKTEISKFYGTWEAKSAMSKYLYGNIEVTIKDNGTWTGNITDEKLQGRWTNKGNYIRMHNDLFSFNLAYSDSGKLLFIDDENEEDINIVLTHKN